MIKAVFFDVDGTLVGFRQKYLSDRLLADLKALRERGIKLFISSGRALQDLERTGMLRDAQFDGYLTLGGQYCCDADGTVFRDMPIGRDDLRGAYEVFRTNPQLCAIIEGNGESYLTQINDRVREIYEFLHTEPYPVRPLEWLLEGKIYQIAPFVMPEEERLLLDAMPGCIHSRWHPKGIDILAKGGGKGAAVQAALDRYGLTADEIIAFGDGENDLPMIKLAGTGVIMGNAQEPVKAAADYVTASVDEDGVSRALRHLGLLPSEP